MRDLRLRFRFASSGAVAATLLAAATAGAQTSPFFGVHAKNLERVHGGLPLAFAARPAADGSRRALAPAADAAVSIRFVSPPTTADLAKLVELGAKLERRRDGSVRGRRSFVLARVTPKALSAVAALPRVERVTLDGSPFGAPRPLDVTAKEIQATDAWETRTADGTPLTGHGITIGDVDSGIDVFHPLFFRADGGYFAWIDVDGDGSFRPDVDAVDLDGDGAPETVRVLNSAITSFWSDEPQLGSEDPSFAIGLDWLYADANGSGAREYGRSAGFDDATPTFGERLLVVDDVNHNGKLDADEKLVALGTSKVKAVRVGSKIFRRDENLVDVPVEESFAHGSGASGVLAGGNRGLTKLVGIAPDADLVMASETKGGDELVMTDFCVDEGARVVLHEYAPWQGYHLDGSSDLEQYIDDTVGDGIAHVNPAGNLSTSQKLSKRMIPAGAETVLTVAAPPDSPYAPFAFLGITLLWRDTSRDLTVVLEDPTGFTMQLTNTGPSTVFEPWHDGLTIYAERDDSTRGTAKVDIYLFGQQAVPPPIPLGDYKVHVTDPLPAGSPDLELIGWVQDEQSGWGKGIFFPDFVSEDHLIGYPGTADHGLAVAAYTGHGWHGATPGERADYSGRGHRIDGEAILSISGPDDPITAGYRDGSPAVYFQYGGTSGASPHVAGAAALLIQADPSRTGDDVRAAIRQGALADSVVGAAPNDDFGYGKLRVYESLYGEPPPGGSAPQITVAPAAIAAGEKTTVPIDASDAEDAIAALTFELDRDYDGTYEETLAGPSFEVESPDLGRRVAKVRVTDSTGKEAAALAVIDVVDAPKAGGPAGTLQLIAGGGGGCATAPGRSGASGAAGLAIAALSLLRRRGARRPRSR